jgi:hypothetical protein
MSTVVQTYSDELLLGLRRCDVPGAQIAEALAEVQSHVADTGEDPRQAFGPPRQYAAEVAAALGLRAPTPFWQQALSWSTVAHGLGGAGGGWLVLDGVLAGAAGERGVLGLPPVVPLLLGVAVLTALGVSLVRLSRSPEAEVLDPRTGARMTSPLPRWVVPLMVLPVLLPLVAGIAVALLHP